MLISSGYPLMNIKHLIQRLLPRSVLLALLVTLVPLAGAEGEEEANTQKVQYIEMRPPFVVNYGDPATKLKFAKVDISLRVNTQNASQGVEAHMPALRNEIVLLLSRQTESTMGNVTGRESLREEALENLNNMLKEETGRSGIADLLFTTFVVQR